MGGRSNLSVVAKFFSVILIQFFSSNFCLDFVRKRDKYVDTALCMLCCSCIMSSNHPHCNNNNNNNKQICIAPQGRNFKGAGPGSMLVSRERRESLREEECFKPKLENCNCNYCMFISTSLMRTVCGSEFQTAGAEHRKARFANVVVKG